jgi:hypothetical protein
MAVRTDYKRGLTIPEHVKKTLSRALIKLLERDGYGISFNSNKSAQMRYMFLKQDFGGSYPLSAYKNWQELLLKAMADYEKLGKNMPNGGRYCSPDKGVRYCERIRKDRSYAESSYQVHFKKDGKSAFKMFYCGNENTMTTERKKHAKLTAWHFRKLYCKDGDPSVFDSANTKNWQTKKYYDE